MQHLPGGATEASTLHRSLDAVPKLRRDDLSFDAPPKLRRATEASARYRSFGAA